MQKFRELMFSKFFKLLVSFFCGTSAIAQAPDTMNILFIGNSYTHMNSMPFIFDKIAKAKGKSVNVEMSTHSGFSFKQHSERADMYEAIVSRKWDYVVLQGYSREFTHPIEYLDTATIPFLTGIVDTIKTNNPCTQLLFYMTWGYKNGYELDETVDNYFKMSDTIAKGYRYVSDYFNIPIVPVGRVWKKVREEYPEVNLYDADLAHPSKSGSYLSACTFFTSIYRESPLGVITNTISSENAKIIQEAAANYVLPRLNEYKLDSNIWDVEFLRTKDGDFMANLYAHYPMATSISWDLGDGNTSTDPVLKHIYKKPGKYNIELEVTDSCGIRTYKKQIEFLPLKEPVPVPKVKPKKKAVVKKRI